MDVTRFLRLQWDRALAMGLVVIGAVMLLVGWYQASGSGIAAQQLPYVMSCGIGALFVLGLAATLWLSADLRDEWRKLDELRSTLLTLPATLPDPFDSAAVDQPTPEVADAPVRRRAHRGRSAATL